jgi:adenylylsulfate kinase-like enzyme
VIAAALAVYGVSLDEAVRKVLSRLNNGGNRLRMLWVSVPSSSGKTTTTVKLTQQLENRACVF